MVHPSFSKLKVVEKMEKLFEIDGFSVMADSIYTVMDKIDYNLNKGFIDAGVSKVPGTGDSASCPFDHASNVYKHGFLENSPVYAYESDKNAVRSKVKELQENVLKPFLAKRGLKEEDLLSHKANSFWDDYMVSFNDGTKFRTNNPDHVMALYIAILSGRLAPVGLEDKARYVDSCYIVDSVETKRQRFSDTIKERYKAVSYIQNNIKDLNKLKALFLYSGEDAEFLESEEATLVFFENIFKDNPSKIRSFNDTCLKYEEEDELKVEIELYRRLYNLKKENSPLLTVSKNEISYKGVVLGVDLKSSAKKFANTEDEELMKEVEALLFDSVGGKK